jgi:DNA-directed RNA polymerase beta' subunit
MATSEKNIKNIINDAMAPRFLTDDEITDILSVVPKIKSASKEVSEYNTTSLHATLKEQLKEIVITPLAIPDIKEEFIRQYSESIIKPGTVVGVTAAEALGQPITQMALNSFHQSGSSKNVTYGIDRIRELINASKVIKTTSCSIFFENQGLSFDDIITKVRPELTEVTIGDLVTDTDIEAVGDLVEPWWYSMYRTFIKSEFQSKYILKVKLNVNMMYAYKITMKQISKVIEADQSLVCVYSPLSVGEIHLYPIEQTIMTEVYGQEVVTEDNAGLIFLWKIVVPAFDSLKVSGVEGIKQIYPVETPVWQIVKDEQRNKALDNSWFLLLNEVRMKITGIKVDKLVNLCETVGIKVIKSRPNYIAVVTPDGVSPSKLVLDAISADKEDEKAYEKRKREEKANIIRRPPTKILTASQMVYADTDGSVFKGSESTLRYLLAHPNIDSTRTFCNNVHEIKAVLGIEAARSFLIKEFSDVIGYEGSYVNPRHIVLMVDYMVSLGEVNGITFSGVSRQPIGALEKASFEKAMDTFDEAANFGESKEVIGTSASIYVGKTAQIGTGFSETYMDKSKYKELEEEIDTNPGMKLDIGDFIDAIGEMTDIISGEGLLVMEGIEDEMFDTDEQFIPGGTVLAVDTVLPVQNTTYGKGTITKSAALVKAGEKFETILEGTTKTCPTALADMKPTNTIIPPKLKVEEIKTGLTMAPLPTGPMTTAIGLPATLIGQIPDAPVKQTTTGLLPGPKTTPTGLLQVSRTSPLGQQTITPLGQQTITPLGQQTITPLGQQTITPLGQQPQASLPTFNLSEYMK